MKRIGNILGRRVRGDIDLGLASNRSKTVRLGVNAPDWARILTPGGQLPGGVWQDIYTQSATQNFRQGTRMAIDDRVFHYGYSGEALIRMMGAYNHDQWPINAALLTAAVIGQATITVPEATCIADEYAGGSIVLFTGVLQERRIIGNDASDGTEAILYLDGAWELGAVIGTWVTGYRSIYANIQAPPAPNPDYMSFVCVPRINVLINRWFWGQTWGPCYGVADSTVPGSTANARDVYFATSGNLLAAGAGVGFAAYGHQRAGYLIPRCTFGNGDQHYMLQLQP